MLKEVSRTRLVGSWFAGVAVIVGLVVVLGVNVTFNTAALLLTICLVPPGMLLLFWHGEPSRSFRDLVYSEDQKKRERS